MAEHFFLIEQGTVSVTVPDPAGAREVRRLQMGDYFGERALLRSEVRSASCTASEETHVLRLTKHLFVAILGTFRNMLEQRIVLQDETVEFADLLCEAVVGRGTFGTVKLVRHRHKPELEYALKCVKRKHVIEMNQQVAMQIERRVLAECFHPCIVQFIKSFKDRSNVYFLTEFLGGGDLFFAIRALGLLTKNHCQFFAASVIMAIDFLHKRGYMYRDLKPENILLDREGYLKLVDFGCCDNTKLISTTLVGTPEYLAPEVILGKGYSRLVDWWAMGVVMYEFICGPLPFVAESDDQLELFRQILQAELKFPRWVRDPSAIGILSNFLERTPQLRLGASKKGIEEIKQHPYFQGYSYDAICARTVVPPWKPDMEALSQEWITCDQLLEDEDAQEIEELDALEKMCEFPDWHSHF